MEHRLQALIEQENKKKPWTDEQLAEQLHSSREEITGLRKRLGIPDSRARRKPAVLEAIRVILTENPAISDRGLAKALGDQDFEIAKYAASRLRAEAEELFEMEGYEKKIFGKRQEENTEAEMGNNHIFADFIGSGGSLKAQILRAQAAVQYPPKGLHCLIYGPSGVGKSYLAELMYKYACTTDIFGEGTPYFEFNCADYADNPQLLLAQLFGYSKGAFTGANENRKGIVELCDGGILFLDEVHRLPPEGQEILFYLMDKGKFRRMGEVDTQRESHLMVIAATTEEPQSALLLTFRRRIPMIIEIPALKDRPLSEKLQFISLFFTWESVRLGQGLRIREEVVRSFLLSECQGNAGQLKSDIQVCCARAFLENKRLGLSQILVTRNNLPETARKQTKLQEKSREADALLSGDLYVFPDKTPFYRKNPVREWNIYEDLEEKYLRMKAEGLQTEQIVQELSGELESSFQEKLNKLDRNGLSASEVMKIVGEEAFQITREIYEYCQKRLPLLKSGLLTPLSIHIREALERLRNQEQLLYAAGVFAGRRDTEEYQVAKAALEEIGKRHLILFPEAETGFLSIYLNKFQEKKKEERIGLLVISHGQVATGMANVANAIMGTEHAQGLDLNLWETPEQMAERVLQKAKAVNEGKGVLVLADMGSLLQLEERIREEIKAPCRLVGRTDTMMVMEAVRKTMWTEESLDAVADGLLEENGKHLQTETDRNRKKAILCLCVTGQGAARELSRYIRERMASALEGVELVERGYLTESSIRKIFAAVEQRYEILAVAGTLDPEDSTYPFVSAKELYEGTGIPRLRSIVRKKLLAENNILSEVIEPDTVFISRGNPFKDEIIDHSVQVMLEKGCVKPEFLLSVYKREGMMTTALNGGIAIPHGSTELVTKPVICVTKLDTPISWDGISMVDLIFTLALTENSKKYFEQLYQILSDNSWLSLLRNADSEEKIYEILTKNT